MSSEDKKPIGKLVQQNRTNQIIKRTIKEKEIEVETNDNQIRKSIDKKPFYGYISDPKEMSLALDITTSEGNFIGLHYHLISSLIRFDRSGIITFKTSEAEIKIEGRNLRPIYEYLLEHRLVWIAGKISEWEQFKEDETVIDTINITDLGDLV